MPTPPAPTDPLASRPASQDFFLGDMGAIYDAAAGQTDLPHRHDYYTVLLVEAARGEHRIDYRSFPFQERQVHFVSPGQVHQVAVSERPRGWVFTFSRAFLVENNIPESFLSNINLFQPFGESPPLDLDPSSFDRLRGIIREMEACLPRDFTYHNRALGALLQLFLIYCSNSTTIDSAQLDEENAGVCLLRDFKQQVEQQYTTWHKVQDYAAAVHVTPKHLSQTVKNLTGKTAKEVIQDRLVLEAQRLLLHTELSIKEIAYRTGFEEPLHFSSFFKKQAGVAPTAFRTTHRK
jgi:AraC-like DNA-binding protein